MFLTSMNGDLLEIQSMLDAYFTVVLGLCSKGVYGSVHAGGVRSGASGLMNLACYLHTEEDFNYALFLLQKGFVDLLMVYDVGWIWGVFNDLSRALPETALN